MTMELSAFRGSMDLYYQLYNSAGVKLDPVYDGGNFTDVVITPDAETTDVVSTKNADYGQAADSMTDAKPTKISLTTNRFNSMLWTVAFMGTMTARSAASATVTDEEVTVTEGGLFKVAGVDISAVTITDETGVTTYVLDTDYEIVDAALGLFRNLDNDIADGDTILVDYTTAAETGYVIKGGIDSSKFIYIFGRGVNRFNNKRTLLQVDKIAVTPSGGFSFVSTDPTSMTLEGTIVTPGDGTEGYRMIVDA